MTDKENQRPYTKRNVEGDASETGLVKFVQPLLMGGEFGLYNRGGLDGIRKEYPIVPGVDEVPAQIPFSSDIKFNLIIRDMCPENKNPGNKKDNMTIFLKGAPERVLGRCKTILVGG